MSSDRASRREATIRSIAEILEIDSANIKGTDKVREDLGMDSLGSLELLSVLSEELRIDLEIDQAMGIVTVDDACDFVERAYVEQRGGEAGTATQARASDG